MEFMYKAMLRNGFYLPKRGCSIITHDYMKGVREKIIWYPMYHKVKLKPCPDPPSKAMVLKEIFKIADGKKINLGFKSEAHLPNRDWLLIALCVFDEDHLFFHKYFLPPA